MIKSSFMSACRIMLALYGLALSTSGFAELNVIATTTSMGMLAKEVGGDHVSVKTLAAPDRDTHYLQAKPSMMLALRNADLLVYVGAELEIGWLPAAINNSANPQILAGEPGHFEAAAHLELLDKGEADRSQGDVHPDGNPHFNLDPLRMATLASKLAERLSQIDKAHQADYQRNSEQLIQRLHALLPQLKAIVKDSPGALLMHKDGLYLLSQLAVPVLGYMEPVPGIPPTANHIKALADRLKGKKGVIIHAPYYQSSGPKKLAGILGWPRKALPIEPPKKAGFDEYQQLLTQWAQTVAL